MKVSDLIGFEDLEKPVKRTQFTARIKTSVLDQVKERAIKNKRSTIKEIEFLLEKAILKK